MLMQQTSQVNSDFIPKLNLANSPYHALQQHLLAKRRTIVLQPPPCFQASPTQSLVKIPQLDSSLYQHKDHAHDLLAMRTRSEPTICSDLTTAKESESEKSGMSTPQRDVVRNKVITKSKKDTDEMHKQGRKIYEISRFFVKNYVGALKSTIHNTSCADDIMDYLGCQKEHLDVIKQELEKLLKENPKHNRMQLYKLITNPILNPIFQYFLRRKVVSWIFTSSKMQDKNAHLLARKNFLHLCLKAKEVTPNNFKIALNFK